MNGEQPPHDAQKTPTDLRDHLARHDKPIAFFGDQTNSEAGNGRHRVKWSH
jgi:hypothetical protein